MKSLKLIKQLDMCGCSIACLAMLVDKSYFEVRDILHQNIDRLKNVYVEPTHIGLYGNELLDALIGVFNVPCRFVKFTTLHKLKKHCILLSCSLNGDRKISHAVVFDAKNNCILDPLSKERNDLDDVNIFCCIEIV